MGFSKKHQLELTKDSEAKKWVIAGIAIRAPLKPVLTKVRDNGGDDNNNGEDSNSTTPTAREARLPEKLSCPAAPRKRRPASTCQVVREFFNPPDLESVFMCHAERAS